MRMKITEAAKTDFHFTPCPLPRAPVLVRQDLQGRSEGWVCGLARGERRGPATVLQTVTRGRDSKKSKTGDSRKTGNRNKNRKLFSCRSTREVWKRSFAGEEGQTEVSTATKQYNLASLVRG